MDLEPVLTESTEPSQRGAAAAPPSQSALIVVVCGATPSVGTFVVPVRGVQRVEIGRATGDRTVVESAGPGIVRLSIPDAKISSRHGWVDVLPEAVVVHDHASKNGWYVQGERVTAPTVVAELSPVILGSTLLVLSSRVAPIDQASWPFFTTQPLFARELHKLGLMASTTVPILLLGETGVGKEVVARAVHDRSKRPGAFVAVNCGALPAGLVEAQLFGHKRGAFSGATSDATGLFRAAHHGTLLLDEIGDLPLSAQPALLRALQEGEVLPVGSVTPQNVDVRVVAATHKPLEQLVAEGQFRADLYARLRGFVLTIPPLRERREDLGHLIARILVTHGLDVKLGPDAIEELYGREFSLNVRELSQALVTAAHLSEGQTIHAQHLPSRLVLSTRSSAPPSRVPVATSASVRPVAALDEPARALRDELEKRLQDAGGNVTQVARDMGKARSQIQRWMRRFGLRES